MKHDTEKDHFEEMTKYLTTEARWFALDGLACTLHNEGYSLQGNTEANDVLWLARMIYSREGFNGNQLDQLPDEEKQRYLDMAEVALKALPALCERIAARYICASKAIRAMEKISREQAAKMTDEKRKRRHAL